MEFRTMVMITLYARQQKRHRCIEQSFGLCGRGRWWDDLGEWHWNMYNIIYEANRQSRFDAWYWMLGAGALGWPREMVQGGWREGSSGWETRVYLWQIHVDVWQNQYNIVKLKNKIKQNVRRRRKKKNLLFNAVKVAQSCRTLCNPMNCSQPGSSVHGILQARTLEWVAFPFSRGSSQPRDRTQVFPVAQMVKNLPAM